MQRHCFCFCRRIQVSWLTDWLAYSPYTVNSTVTVPLWADDIFVSGSCILLQYCSPTINTYSQRAYIYIYTATCSSYIYFCQIYWRIFRIVFTHALILSSKFPVKWQQCTTTQEWVTRWLRNNNTNDNLKQVLWSKKSQYYFTHCEI